ncbi:TPM domain-containing protein [Streptomyces sp. NPDC049879]|uniref:TPM domain-containing protein n=1 Tax=Streptomyces sp. NPDC049879 TaxID=3365598 RepID=UPI00379C49E9
MRARPAAALTAALAACLTAVPLPAVAADTVTLDHAGQITDQVGALGGRTDAVQRALIRLEDEERYQLFVVYVRDFSGHEAQSWADGVADRNRLGAHDLLLAFATHERRYALSADVHSGFSARDLARVESVAVAPALRHADWAGAAIGAAEGFAALQEGGQVRRPAIVPGDQDPGPSPGRDIRDWVVPLVLLAGAAALVVFLIRHGERSLPPVVPLTALDTHVRGLLIDLDDAVRAREAGLSFTPAAPRSALAELEDARAGTATALREWYEADATAAGAGAVVRRRTLIRIAERCALAQEHLAAAGPVAAAGTAGAVAAAEARTAAVTAPARALPVARARLAGAREELARARRALARNDRSATARAVRAARDAVAAAETLLAATARRTAAQARARVVLAEAAAGTAADLAEARAGRAAPGTVARAAAALAGVRRAHDPLDALRTLLAEAAPLAGDLAEHRTPGERERRARALLAQAMLLAHTEVSWADALVTAHRAALGTATRARLAAARSVLDEAAARADREPVRALAAARLADALARASAARTERDAGPLT